MLLVGLAVGLMHTVGWLGPTCRDEWQISSMLVAIGVVILYVIGMNQVHHGGLWGKLHNYSKIPDIQVTNYQAVSDSTFILNLYRDKGPETYGSFLIQLEIKNSSGETVYTFGQDYMKTIDTANIHNRHINKIKPGKHSLLVPLGAEGKVTFHLPENKKLKTNNDYTSAEENSRGNKKENNYHSNSEQSSEG
jgi:thiosulfate dehydrogenase [quinone] large subunit